MDVLKVEKVVSNISTPQPNTIYFIRIGNGFDLHITTETGEVIKSNFVKSINNDTPSVDGESNFDLDWWLQNQGVW